MIPNEISTSGELAKFVGYYQDYENDPTYPYLNNPKIGDEEATYVKLTSYIDYSAIYDLAIRVGR